MQLLNNLSWLKHQFKSTILTIIAGKIESNIHIHNCSSLIRYATSIDSFLITAKGAETPYMDSSRIMSEGKEGVIL